MSKIVNFSIDYDMLVAALKADASLIKSAVNGKRFLNFTLNESKEVKYGNTHYVTFSSSKEERAAGKKTPIIGNGKEFVFGGQQAAPMAQQTQNYNVPPASPSAIEDLPF
jgi:hypothetical protein